MSEAETEQRRGKQLHGERRRPGSEIGDPEVTQDPVREADIAREAMRNHVTDRGRPLPDRGRAERWVYANDVMVLMRSRLALRVEVSRGLMTNIMAAA